MQIELNKILVRDIFAKYKDDNEGGVTGYNGDLNIRPEYQREFLYKDKQRDAVLATVRKGFPLGSIYWVKNSNLTFEVLDGQQRIISICQYINGDYAIDHQYFHNLEPNEKNQILNYTLMVYFCEGEDSEKLDWFKTINISGVKLSEQELRNAVYSGPWLSDAKKKFSKSGCPAYDVGSKYLKGTPIRQDYLETALKWISDTGIENYMAKHQHSVNATELWLYFDDVIKWTKRTFKTYRREIKGIPLGKLYNKFKDEYIDPVKLDEHIRHLLWDEDVTKKSGIFSYVLTKEEKLLNIRSFTPAHKRETFERQKGLCPVCGVYFNIDEMEADHITPWCKGGKTTTENCQLLCRHDNRIKSST